MFMLSICRIWSCTELVDVDRGFDSVRDTWWVEVE
jgi:hypothetical protein